MVQDPWGDGGNEPINYEEQHLSGIPQQGMFPHGNQVFLQTPSAAPKVIGVIFIIYGLISSLGVFSPFIEQRDFQTGKVIEFPLTYHVLSVSGSIVAAITAFLGGLANKLSTPRSTFDSTRRCYNIHFITFFNLSWF